MDAQQPREQLIAELKRQGLPRAYIQRLLGELDDHLADLQDERTRQMNTAGKPEFASAENESAKIIKHDSHVIGLHERLGDPAKLAAFAAEQYRNRSFLGRHPILTFLVLPLPLALLLAIVIFFSTCLIGEAIAWVFPGVMNADSIAEFDFYNQHLLLCNLLMATMAWLWTVLPPLLAALFLFRIARRNLRSIRWSIAACTIIALWAGMFYFECRGPTRPGNGLLLIGLCAAPTDWHFLVKLLPRFAIAFSIGWLLLKRAQRLQKIDETSCETALLRQAA